jgi:hypothetical protein
VKWITDKTGRFPQRPFYEDEELDYACEALLVGFLSSKYETVQYPITTNDLTILLDQVTDDLDTAPRTGGQVA